MCVALAKERTRHLVEALVGSHTLVHENDVYDAANCRKQASTPVDMVSNEVPSSLQLAAPFRGDMVPCWRMCPVGNVKFFRLLDIEAAQCKYSVTLTPRQGILQCSFEQLAGNTARAWVVDENGNGLSEEGFLQSWSRVCVDRDLGSLATSERTYFRKAINAVRNGPLTGTLSVFRQGVLESCGAFTTLTHPFLLQWHQLDNIRVGFLTLWWCHSRGGAAAYPRCHLRQHRLRQHPSFPH